MALQKMSNLDYCFLVEELKPLVGSRLSGIYEVSPRTFRLKFSKERWEFNLIAELGVRMHLTKYLEPSPAKPTRFTALLKPRLEGLRLKAVEQLDFDRLLRLDFEGRGNPSLVLEMFREGNLVLVSEDKITAVYEKKAYAARSLKPGEAYETPPAAEIQPSELTSKDFSALKGPLVVALAKALNLAPFYLEEACSRAGIAYKKEAAELTESEKTNLAEKIAGLLNLFEKEPILYYKENRVENYAPIAMKKFAGMKSERRATFCEALDEYYRAAKSSAKAKDVEAEVAAKRLRLERVLEAQKQALEENERKAVEAKALGDAIYRNYAAVSEALALARELKEKKLSDEEIKARLNELLERKLKLKLRGRTAKMELLS